MSTAEPDEPLNVGSSTQVRRRARSEKQVREDQLTELQTILANPGARRFLWRLMTECKLLDPITDSIDEGKRRIGLWTFREIEAADPEAFALMQKEARAQ